MLASYLYHLLWLHKPEDRRIVAEYGLKLNGGKSKHIDLALLKQSNDEIRLLIEIKETGSKLTSKKVEARVNKDIDKMAKALSLKGTTHTRKPIQIFFFRKMREIKPEDFNVLENSLNEFANALWKDKNKKTRFFWGPRRNTQV